MDWRIKGVVQGLLARIPAGDVVNDGLQLLAGGRVDEAEHIDRKFRGDWLVLMRVLRELKFKVQGETLMEVGTGWLPVLPLCFALCGARTVHSFDLNRHVNRRRVPIVLQRLGQHLSELAAACGQSEAELRERHALLMSACQGADAGMRVMELAGIEYHAPADATCTGLPDASMALVFSNSVLEHVCADVLGPLMAESKRLLKPQGLALHSVNCGDHYAYFDRSITPLNYLRFTASQWQRWNNGLLYQNRLRPSDFTALASQQGLKVVHLIQTERQDLLARIPSDQIAPEFRHYDARDLATTSITFAAQP
jgi:SAM-dependent methyltransferase